MSHVDVVLCKLLATLPEKDNKMINVIFASGSDGRADFLRQLAIPIVVETIDNLADIGHKRDFNLIFTDKDDDLRKFRAKFSSQLFDSRGYYIIIIANDVSGDIFEWFWQRQILNVNVIREESAESVTVLSYFPFNRLECGNTRAININLTSTSFFPDKLADLHNCEVRIATSQISQPSVFTETTSNGTIIRLYGRDISLINALSQAINFRVNVVYVGVEGALWNDGKAEGPFKLLLDDGADLIIADYWLMPSRLQFIDSTLPYTAQHIAFIIPPGAPYTSFRKLVLPFDACTWTILISIFLISFIVIFGAGRRLQRELMFRIFGISTSSADPYLMDLIRAILGGAQKILPQSNSGRILLMTLLMLCLVMRTVYLASLYKYLQKNIKHKEVQSIDDMIERNFDVYYLTSVKDLMDAAPTRLRNRLIGVTIAQRAKIIPQVYNPSFKGAFLRSLTGIQYMNQVGYKDTEMFTVCKENFMTIPVVIYARKDLYLIEKINEKIRLIQAAGLIDYWHSQGIDKKFLRAAAVVSGEPIKISMSHLSSCFTIWMFGLIIALIIFIAENCKFRLKKKMTKR